MKAIGNNIIFELIDNTKRGLINDDVFVKGFTEHSRQVIPNCGRVIDSNCELEVGDIIHFYEFGIKYIEGLYIIDENNIFLRNGFLRKPGLIVKKFTISQGIEDLFKLRDQDFFAVVDSTIATIDRNDFIVIRPRMCHRFNYDTGDNIQEYFFVSPQSVMLHITNKEIKPGPTYMMLEEINDSPAYLHIDSLIRNNCGLHNNELFKFVDNICTVELNNIKYKIMHRESVYMIQ